MAVEPVIDAHSHVGDILYPGGASLIDKTGVTKAAVFDPAALGERFLFQDPLSIAKPLSRLFGRCITKGERARNFTATLENFSRSMDECGISYSVGLPIPPYVSYADLARAAEKEPRLVAFTGIDYTRDQDPGPRLADDVSAGARGLKLHPVIQNIPLTSKRTMEGVEAFSTHGLPVLFHCGVSSYYLGKERTREQPSYGEVRYGAELVRSFPQVRFIVGHAGLFDVGEVMTTMAGCKNVWVDTSFQSAATVCKLITTFGPDRILYASDWPYGNRPPALAVIKAACAGDQALERRLLFENAAELLGLHPL